LAALAQLLLLWLNYFIGGICFLVGRLQGPVALAIGDLADIPGDVTYVQVGISMRSIGTLGK